MLRAGNMPLSPHNFTVLNTKAHLGLNLGLGSNHVIIIWIINPKYKNGIKVKI
jgi:hypothetical protein